MVNHARAAACSRKVVIAVSHLLNAVTVGGVTSAADPLLSAEIELQPTGCVCARQRLCYIQLNGCVTMTPPMTHVTDRIEKTTVLRAPQTRVWRALTDAKQFATWFGITLDEAFVVGRSVTGQLSMRGEQFTIDFSIERMEPEHTFAYRWHPYAIDKNTDYSAEPMTLVEFRLKSV